MWPPCSVSAPESHSTGETDPITESAAKVLVDQSGEGYSPLPLLVKYAELKGYDLSKPQQQKTFSDWINAMSMDKLATLRDNIHLWLDDWDGDVSKFQRTSITDPIVMDQVNAREFIGRDEMTGEPIYGSPRKREIEAGGPAPMQSVVQFDATLGMLGLQRLPPPPN